MAFTSDVFNGPQYAAGFPSSPFGGFEAGSLYDSFMRSMANSYVDAVPEQASVPSAVNQFVNYADPAQTVAGPVRGLPKDIMQLDADPFGTQTAAWARDNGIETDGNSVVSLDVFGRRMSRDTLMQSDSGRRLVEIAERRRRGQKRGFWDALLDFSWEDLPFMSLFATVGKSIADAVTVSDTFRKLQNGDPVTDDELIKTRLYMAEGEERENGTWGATVGDIMRAAPGFMAEFFVSGGMYSAMRTGLSKVGKEGIHLGMTRATKILAREAMQEAAEKQVAKAAVKGAEGFARLGADAAAKKSLVNEVADTILKHAMNGNPLYAGLSDDVLKGMAKSRAEYEFSKMLARNAGGKIANGFNTFAQWLGQNASRGLMDFGAWGTEEATVLTTGHSRAMSALADAVGTFLVDAPLKGALMWAPNQFIARPVLGAAFGQDGRTVGAGQLGLEQAAYMTGNRELMESAEAMSHGLSLLEYVSENTGRGLSSMMRAAGLGLEKAGVRGLVKPATRAIGVAEDSMDAVTLGGKVRQWVAKVFGSREEYRTKTVEAKIAAVAGKLGVTEANVADMRAIGTAVRSGSVSGLRAELAEQVGPDIGKFAAAALKEMSAAEREKLGYKTYAKFWLADWMARHQVGPETVMNLFDRLGYDGVLGEMFEERYSDFAKGLFGWDDRSDHDVWSNLKTAVKNLYPGWDQLTAEAMAFAMPMVMRSGILRVQSALSGGEGDVRKIKSRLAVINDALRLGTVATMTPGEYLANHQRLAEKDEADIAELERRRDAVQGGVDDAAALAAERALAEPKTQRNIAKVAERAARRAKAEALEAGLSGEEVEEAAAAARERAARRAREKLAERVTDAERKRLSAPGSAQEAVAQLDEDIARARKVMERRKEVHEAFAASIPEAAVQAAETIAVPMYTNDDLADDARYNRAPVLTAQQANEVIAGRNALVEYSPELGRKLVEMESSLEGDDPSWWRRAAHRLIGVAGALATGDFSMAAMNPAQWTARDMGLSRHVVDVLKKNMRDSVEKARKILSKERGTASEAVARLRGAARRAQESGQTAAAADLNRQADAIAAQYGEGGTIGATPSRKEVFDLAERLSAPAARQLMAANLTVHHLRSFTREQAQDQAMGIVARELGYEWFADGTGALQFYKYAADGKSVDQASVLGAGAFLDANRERVEDTRRELVAATVDVLTRRLTRAGDDSVRLLNAVSLPDSAELRYLAAAKRPDLVGPVSSDSVMREAALYDAACRMVGAGSLVERVRIDGTTPLAETLDRGAIGRVNMATIDYISQFDKVEDVADRRALEALAWSLGLQFDGTEEGLRKRDTELFNLAKLATHFNRGDKAFYSRPTPIDDADASRLTPNGNLPLAATLVDGKWVVDLGRNADGSRRTETYDTREQMDEALRGEGYLPDKSRLVLTLARAIESSDMFTMIRELGLGLAYRDMLGDRNLHPMLRRDADGNYLSEDEAQKALRAELAAAEGGESAKAGSRERAAWEAVWGESGYMRLGERLLHDNGVDKSVVSKYAGEFSDYSPPVYTLKLSAGRLSPTSANVYVPVDPLVCPDVVSGVVNGLLIHSFMTHPRLVRDALNGTIADFAEQVRAVIDAHIHASKDKSLVEDLERLRRFAVESVSKAAVGEDGEIRVYRGAGMTAASFATLASAFVLGRESDYAANPQLRACAEIAADVRMCPAFADFCDVVDITLGGAGPITAAARIAAKADENPAETRGLQRVMVYASSDPKRLESVLKEMRPLGLEPLQFLNLCTRRLAAMARSGAPAVSQREAQDLEDKARAAQARPAPETHFPFYGSLIAVVRRAVESDGPVDVKVRDFFADVAEAAQDEPGVTQRQKKALKALLGILRRTRVVGAAREKYAAAFDETLGRMERYDEAKKACRDIQRELREAARRGEETSAPDTWAARQEELNEFRRLRARLRREYSESLKNLRDASVAVQANAGGGATNESVLVPPPAVTVGADGTPDAEARAEELNDRFTTDITHGVEDEDEDAETSRDAVDDAAGIQDAVELPAAAALGEDRAVMSHGYDEVPVEMPRSAQRLCVNVCVRAVAMRAEAAGAEALDAVVTEDSVVDMAREMFHIYDQRVLDAIRHQYRVADDIRMRGNHTWEDYAKSGVRWEFQEDDKDDEDVSSDDFSNRALAEYNSPFLKDALELATRVAPESVKNLRAFLTRVKEWLRLSAGVRVAPGVTAEVDGVPIIWEQSSDGHVSDAWYDPKDGTIHVYADGVRAKYESGAWKSPERSSAVPGAELLIRSADDLVAWAVYHELGYAKDRTPRDMSEAGKVAREDRANSFASRRLSKARQLEALQFASAVLDPRLDARGKTQAEQSALHMKALERFDTDPGFVANCVGIMLSADDRGFPVSRRLAFLLSYLAALPVEDRRNFALLCANSVSAEAVRAEAKWRDGAPALEMGPRRVGAGDKVSDRIVGDTFVHVLAGKDASAAADAARRLRESQAKWLAAPRHPKTTDARIAGAIVADVFGRESPLVTALASEYAADHRAKHGSGSVNKALADSVAPKDGKIAVVESIAATLDALAEEGQPLTEANVTAAFVRTFETGRPDKSVGVLRNQCGPSFTDPLKTWLSTYTDSLPATILSADVDQRRESSGSSVPVAPRDSVPMVSRWIYSDEAAKGIVDGRIVTFPTFSQLARQMFPGTTDAQIEKCRQDACWPDGSPVCAKNTSSSLTTREMYLACERAYKAHMDNPRDGQGAWYIPLYAGDHSSSTMLRIPWGAVEQLRAAMGQQQAVQGPAKPEIVLSGAKDTARKAAEIGGVDTLSHPGPDGMHFGNPFSDRNHKHKGIARTFDTLAEAVAAFEQWLRGTAHQDVEPERRKWIVDQLRSGSLVGKPLVYYTDTVPGGDYDGTGTIKKYDAEKAPHHAHILQKLIAEMAPARGRLNDQVYVSFPGNNPHKAKDEAKFRQFGGITKFIGFGPGSTGLYAKTLAGIANTGSYSATDIVGVSVNGKRKDRVPVRGTDVEREVRAAAASGALIITDSALDRGRDYNVGERELAELLAELGYEEASGTGFWTRQDLRGTPDAWAVAHPPPEVPGVAAAGQLDYRTAAKLMANAVGMNLMYTDTKRSAITSLENQGAGLIGAEVQDDGTVRYGEHRVHIMHNWAFEREGYAFKKAGTNEAMLGTTRMYGYGARVMRTLAKDRESDLLKLHLISTSGHDLFFIKSLVAAASEDEQFLDGSMNRVIEEYLARFRGSDAISTDTFTDDDSYKIGVGNSKAILVEDPATGKRMKLMKWIFSRLRDLCGAEKGATEEEVAGKFKERYSRLTGDALDELVGDVPIVDLARTDGKAPVAMKLSELMPGVMVNAVEGLDGPCLDLSYREDGAMAYTVANVAHRSKVSSEPGRVARNYEVDLMAAAVMLGAGASVDMQVVRDAYDLVSNWGLVAACVYATGPQMAAAAARSSAVEELRLNGEHPQGQNIRSEIAKDVWAQVRKNANLPVKGVDAALVACGASIDDDGRLMAHTKSPMLRAFMRGAEIFTAEEQAFFGRRFRHALCNVNMTAPGFRYSWFLDREAFDAADPERRRTMTDREVILELAKMFARAKRLAEEARDAADADARKDAVARLLAEKKKIAGLFVDHHGVPIWSTDPDKSGHTEKYVQQFNLADLFNADGSFDLSAFQVDADRVHNDATGREHILLGGTKFGFPRTPSYNAHYETVRAGLPVKERKVVNRRTGRETWAVGRDALVSPDPYTNRTLGTDHDGDKSKLYLLHTDAFGLADERIPPSPSEEILGQLGTNGPVTLEDGVTKMRARDAYARELLKDKWLERVWVNPETGEEELVPQGESPEGAYHRVSDRAKLAVSNAFVRTMFTVSDSVPTVGMDGAERVSESEHRRVKCLGGMAFRPVSTQPVLNDALWKEVTDSALDPVLGEGDTIGDPWLAALVATSAQDADGARGTVVALARTLHVAFASGQFADLFGVKEGDRYRQPTGAEWLMFLNHFDGLSNATFDDIKEQICGRLGWTKGMMDTVLVELLTSGVGTLPTTDEAWAGALALYARRIKNHEAEYWMLMASSIENDDFVDQCYRTLGVEDRSKDAMVKAMGVVRQDQQWSVDQTIAPDKRTALQRVVAELADECGVDGFNYIVDSVSGKLGHNSTLGRLAYLVSIVSSAKTERDRDMTGSDLRAAGQWADKRAQLDRAQKFERSVNYLTADPGDAAKYAKYGTDEDAPSVVGTSSTSVGKITDAAFGKMETATRMMYRATGRYATVEAEAVLAAVRREKNLEALVERAPRCAAYLFYKDALPQWDRMGLTANRQQLPYLMSFFLRQAQIAANVGSEDRQVVSGKRAGTRFADWETLYGAVSAMADAVAKSYGMHGKGLAARAAIESLFSIMYRLMVTSTEFKKCAAPVYLRAPADTNFGKQDRDRNLRYGPLGGKLKRIMPAYRAGDRETFERVRAMYDDVVRGRAYSGGRTGGWENGRNSTYCRTFAVTRAALYGYIAEFLPPEAREAYRTSLGTPDRDKALAAAFARIPEDAREEIVIASYALGGLEDYLHVGNKEPVITPAVMFGQLLPMYSLMTSRCLGAPNPSSPSLLSLAPSWMYEEISAGEAELSRVRPELVDSVVAGNWAPYLENVRATGTTWRRREKVEARIRDVDALAASAAPAQADPGGQSTPPELKKPPAEESEFRENPDWRTTVDVFSDGAFREALEAAGPLSARAVPASAPSPGPGPKGKGAYDEKVARVAGALGLAFGTWAEVEYVGGKTFTIRGKLRGTVGQGKNVVFTVDMENNLCESDEQKKALADSEAYGASLAECCPGLGLKSGQDFLRLPRSTRLALVERYGVGGVTMHNVQWKVDGRGVATLVGAIRLGKSKADTTVFHEYFHGMMRVFDAIGLFSEADKAALRKTFGEPTKRGQWFNEEAAAESFRKWVEGKMDAKAQERRGIFRKIYDALKGILLAIRRGFGYTGDSENDAELLFGFVAHGVAQASDSKIEELKANAAHRATAAEAGGDAQEAERLDEAAASLDAAYLDRNSVAVATAIAQIVPPPPKENAKLPSAELAAVENRVLRGREAGLREFDMGQEARDAGLEYELETHPAYEVVPQPDRARSEELKERLDAMLRDPATQAADLQAVMSEMVELRNGMAAEMGRSEQTGPVTLEPEGVGDEFMDFAPGSAEADVEETRDAVKTVTTPMAEVNDFYRASSFIHEALERGLRMEGSWSRPLADVVRKYGTPNWKDHLEEARDKAVVLHGLRNALAAVNPAASKLIDDRRLAESLAFEAALTMYHGLESSFFQSSRSESDPPLPDPPGTDEASHEASQYDVSAWILSSRPLSATETVRNALDATERLLDESGSEPVRAELVRHRDALRKVLGGIDDESGLMELRQGRLDGLFDEAFAMLREGTKMNGHGPDGRMNDITPGDAAKLAEEGKTRALDRLSSFQNTYMVPAVQESLKSALEALWQTRAQVKFYRETGVTPATAEDLEFARQMELRHNAPYATPAAWAATQAIGDSNLADNRPLVDFYCQPAFIADNVDAWLSSLVRKSFGARGNIGDMLSAENREYGALKMRIADLENFYSLLLGTNVEDGGYLLKVEERAGKWKMVHGEIVREDGETYLKVDNYRRKPTKVRLTEADLRVIDLYLKSISAYAAGQDRMITGLDRLWFSPADFEHDWSREAIEAKWNGGHPTAHMTAMEMMLHRLDAQFPADVIGGGAGMLDLRNRVVAAAEAELSAIQEEIAKARARGNSYDMGQVNRRVLEALRAAGVAEVRADRSFGVVTIPVEDVDRMFKGSAAYRKLTSDEGGRKAEWLERDRIAKDFMDVYKDAVRFVRKHPWLVHGDGRHFHGFGTTLPFWRGGGVFMYNCERAERDRQRRPLEAMTATEKAMAAAMSAEDVDRPLDKLEYAAYGELLDRVGEAYGVPAQGVRFAEDVKAGKYEDGQDLAGRTGLVLGRKATKADLARALYDKALEDVHAMATGLKEDNLQSAESIIRMYEDSALERGEIFGNTFGLNDQDIYRMHGKLPANAQIGHKVHIAIDGITNAMMSRATLANLLMTPAADGAPMYYADPSEYAADVSGLPDALWAAVARWWAEWNGLEYDGSLTGVQNAHALYDKISKSRDGNGGKIGVGEYAATYTELARDDARDVETVDHWLVRDDDRAFEESSVVNAVAGGEAMGYLKQFVQAGRTLGFGGNMTRATLHRALSWSKSMSVAFSFFFPLATKWESPIGAVGATATIMSNLRHVGEFLRKHPDLANMMQKAVGGRGWITQNFLGFNDIIEMMDTNDPFLAEMKAWANALGVTLSSSLVNPMEETKSLMTEDLRWLKERIRDRMGAKAAAKFGRIVETVVTRGGDKAFNYALNATKLAVVAQMYMKLRYAAQKKGKAFDPVRDLRRYGRYINAEIGGIDPLRYAWATPLNRGIMNTLLFSWQWTRGAWEAGGGAVIEDLLLGGHTMTREEREYMVGRWCRMFGAVMIGVPALMQCVVMALAKAMGGGDDDDDHWATWNNEDKTKWTAFDLTPLLRAIDGFDSTKLGGAIRRFKQEGVAVTGAAGAVGGTVLGMMNGGNAFTAALGGALGGAAGLVVPSLVPEYTGTDAANRSSRARRYYMHFGKQGWEFFRWFDDAKGQFLSKLSMPTQRILEGVMGRNLSYLDRALPWDEMGQFERWLSPTTDGAAWNLVQAFLPFSLGGVQRTGDAGFLPMIGPVQMGASQTAIQDRLVKAVTAWAKNDRAGYRYGYAHRGKASAALAERVADVLKDARANGFDPELQLNKAYGQVATRLYGDLIDLIPDDPKADYDVKAVERAARAINRVGARLEQVLKSLKARVEARLKPRGLSWKDLPGEDRERLQKPVKEAVGNPFGTVDY